MNGKGRPAPTGAGVGLGIGLVAFLLSVGLAVSCAGVCCMGGLMSPPATKGLPPGQAVKQPPGKGIANPGEGVASPGSDKKAEVRPMPETIESLGGRVTEDLNQPGKPVVGVTLRKTKVTNEGLKQLKEFKELRTLDLTDTQITDTGLKELKEIKTLENLGLSGTQITDAGLIVLQELSNLKYVSLGRTQITDGGLWDLRQIEGLTGLWVHSTRITDAGMKDLKGLKNLQTLDLANTQITDAGLAELKAIKSLEQLGLSNTQVTDAGLSELKQLWRLRLLSLGGTKVSRAGVMGLSKALPELLMVDEKGWRWLQRADRDREIVKTTELILQYRENPVGADMNRKDKSLVVAGLVDSIRKDSSNRPNVILQPTYNSAPFCVQCIFEVSKSEEVAGLQPGQLVLIQGNCSGMLRNVFLRDCSVVVAEFLGN